MNTKPAVRLIKRDERVPRPQRVMAESRVDSNRWSTAIRSWVVEFQERDRGESLPAFDRLFKGALS